MNFIQENLYSRRPYVDLKEVLEWLELNAKMYDWHFAEAVGGWTGFNAGPHWMSGEDLSEHINEQCTFHWAVISAYPVGTTAFESDVPYADGNPEFWTGMPRKQLVDSLFELVFWDSSSTLYIGLPENLAINLMKNAPDVHNLNLENEGRHRK